MGFHVVCGVIDEEQAWGARREYPEDPGNGEVTGRRAAVEVRSSLSTEGQTPTPL